VLDELDRLDPELDIIEVDALMAPDDEAEGDACDETRLEVPHERR